MEALNLSPYHWWAAAAIVLLIAEIFVPGFWLFCLSMGCFAASATAIFSDSISLQLIACAAISLVAFFTLRPLLMKRMWKDNGVRTNVDALVGQRGRVSQDFEAGLRLGRVAAGGDDWRAECVNDQALRIGDVVEVVRVESNTLIVKPVVA